MISLLCAKLGTDFMFFTYLLLNRHNLYITLSAIAFNIGRKFQGSRVERALNMSWVCQESPQRRLPDHCSDTTGVGFLMPPGMASYGPKTTQIKNIVGLGRS